MNQSKYPKVVNNTYHKMTGVKVEWVVGMMYHHRSSFLARETSRCVGNFDYSAVPKILLPSRQRSAYLQYFFSFSCERTKILETPSTFFFLETQDGYHVELSQPTDLSLQRASGRNPLLPFVGRRPSSDRDLFDAPPRFVTLYFESAVCIDTYPRMVGGWRQSKTRASDTSSLHQANTFHYIEGPTVVWGRQLSHLCGRIRSEQPPDRL